MPDTLINLNILDCSITRVNKIPNTYLKLERLSCANSNVKMIPECFINLIYLNCNFTYVNSISPNFLNLKILKVKYTNKIKLSYKYTKLIQLEINTNNYYNSTCQNYLAINFLLTHFKTKFKNVSKFKFINKQSLNIYSSMLLDSYINPSSLSLLYRINKWDNDNTARELLYLTNNNLKIFKLKK